MTKVFVLYYSMYGHIEIMAKAVVEGARSVEGTEVVIKRVPDLVPEDVARKAGAKLDQVVPIATVGELPDYDAIIFGTPTRFGNMCAQMRNFLDQTGRRWWFPVLALLIVLTTTTEVPAQQHYPPPETAPIYGIYTIPQWVLPGTGPYSTPPPLDAELRRLQAERAQEFEQRQRARICNTLAPGITDCDFGRKLP